MSPQPPSALDRGQSVPPIPAPVTGRKSYRASFRTYRWLWIIATVVFIADQVTKEMIAARLPFGSYGPNAQIEVMPGFFNLVHVGNTGAAWSMFSGQSLILALVALGALTAIFIWRHSLGLHQRSVQPCFGLLCGGIVGNLVDRVHYGHVVDFIDLHFGGYIYPTFNVADSAICVGVFWYVLWSLKQPTAPRSENN
jgi:signal peptidase II